MEKFITDHYVHITGAVNIPDPSEQQAYIQFINACSLLQALAQNRPAPPADVPDKDIIDLPTKFREAFDNLARLYSNIEQVRIPVIIPQLDTLLKIQEEISQHPNIRLHTVSYFARKHHIGGSTLKRVFKQHFQITLHDFVMIKCMQKAQRLMENKTLSIVSIAEELGYADRSGFLRTYKKFTEKMIQ